MVSSSCTFHMMLPSPVTRMVRCFAAADAGSHGEGKAPAHGAPTGDVGALSLLDAEGLVEAGDFGADAGEDLIAGAESASESTSMVMA